MAFELLVKRQLTVGDLTRTVEAISTVRRGPKKTGAALTVADSVNFKLSTEDLADRFEDAVRIARQLAGNVATLDGVALQGLHLRSAEAEFADDGSELFGTLQFNARLELPLRLDIDLGDDELIRALESASEIYQPLLAEPITRTDRYYVFRTIGIGRGGVFVDRRDGSAHQMGSGLPAELWIWGYERGLLAEPAGDVVIERVHDASRAMKIQRFARVGSEDLKQLPLVLDACATWLAIAPLHEAGDAIEWHVRRAG